MAYQRMMLAALGLALGLVACGISNPATRAPQLPTTRPSGAAAERSAAPLATPAEATIMSEEPSSSPELAAADIAAQVQADIAAYLRVAPGDIQVLSTEPRIWPDRGLGCVARKGVAEPERIPGYEIIVAYREVRYTYHSDEFGRMIRCPNTLKPLDPIR